MQTGSFFAGLALALALAAGPAVSGDVAAGEARYAETCANCHGPGGKGMASYPRLAGSAPDHLTARLTQYRAGERLGPNSMLMIPNAADLTDEEIANLVAYLSSL